MRQTLIIMALINLALAVKFVVNLDTTPEQARVPVDPKFAKVIFSIAAGLLAMNALCFMAAIPKM